MEELQKSQKVFAEKLNHLSRRLAWINATIYSKVSCSCTSCCCSTSCYCFTCLTPFSSSICLSSTPPRRRCWTCTGC